MGESVELAGRPLRGLEGAPPETPVRLGIVGCGAVAEAHLMAADRLPEADVTVLVDTNEQRAAALGNAFRIEETDGDHRALIDRVDAVIVAVPHHLHAGITIDLVRAGLHVLVEKPMALNPGDTRAMVAAAAEADTLLAVGHLRRFLYSSRFVKRAVETGLLGTIRSFDAREGVIFDWPVTSGASFRADAGGGVLADSGAHTLDLLLWWFGDYEGLRCRDDAMGGVEADCEIELEMASGVTGTVELSRTRNLRNSVILRGDRGSIEVEARFDSEIRLELDGEASVLYGRARMDGHPPEGAVELFERQLANFVRAVRGLDTLFVPGPEGVPVVDLIAAYRAARQPLKKPWMAQPSADP